MQPDDALAARLRETFAAEAQERVANVHALLLDAASEDPSIRTSAVDAISREIHTLKGTGRMIGSAEVVDLAVAIEDMLSALGEGIPVDGEVSSAVRRATELMERIAIGADGESAEVERSVSEMRAMREG